MKVHLPVVQGQARSNSISMKIEQSGKMKQCEGAYSNDVI